MAKLHLCFYELPEAVKKHLKEAIFNHWQCGYKNDNDVVSLKRREKTTREQIDDLFNLNNAGIDIDIYQWMDN